MSGTLPDALIASQQLIAAMIRLAADDELSTRVGAWTLRDIAAHLAATERECFEPRITAMAQGERPRFEHYSNDERDFDGTQLEAALAEWAETRGRLVDYVRGLSEEERQGVGFHQRFGELTVDRYLQIALEHDQDHLRGLERAVTAAAR
jgi:hypothetical protein